MSRTEDEKKAARAKKRAEERRKTLDARVQEYEKRKEIEEKIKSQLQSKYTNAIASVEDEYNPLRDYLVGTMLIYVYIAKFRDKLPYWDSHPLVLPISETADGWLGLNLHYLPPPLRIRLLDSMFMARPFIRETGNMYVDSVNNQKLFSKVDARLMRPCIKRYLRSHVRSRIIKVPVENWKRVAGLSLQNFQKATSAEVWSKVAR